MTTKLRRLHLAALTKFGPFDMLPSASYASERIRKDIQSVGIVPELTPSHVSLILDPIKIETSILFHLKLVIFGPGGDKQ